MKGSEKLKESAPYTLQNRALKIQSIAHAIKERKLGHLDENAKDDIEQILKIVFELYPLTHPVTAKGYAVAAIRTCRMGEQK